MGYDYLFQPGRIGRLTIRNRAVMTAMATEFANEDGTVTMRLMRYYQERAKGGIGLIITEYMSVDHENSVPSPHNLRASKDSHIAGLEMLTDAVHAHGAHVFAQLQHAGSTSKPALSGRQPLGVSDIPIAPGAPAPKPMSIAEIKAVQQKFVEAAARCKTAGYDGVELHGAHSYLIGQFFSPYYNRRDDEYGGSFENRMRFIGEIIDLIRAQLGPGYPIGVRISGDEMTPHIPLTPTLEDGLEIGRWLEKKGIDVLNVSNGSAFNANANCDPYSYEPGWKKHVALAFSQALSIPVIATNTIKNPAFAEQLLKEGVCDFVGLGRSQFADPYFMRKAAEGREAEIRTCIGCMVCRERLFIPGLPISCAVNARMGREYLYPDYPARGAGRRIMVVGSGPAGMEAARVLALKGFDVTLYEKEPQLGGTLRLAAKPKHKELIADLIDGMEAELKSANVTIRLNTEVTPALAREINPEAVFLAAGAVPIRPALLGIDLPHVITAEGLLESGRRLSGRVAVVGAGMTGLEVAEMLLEGGAEVSIIDMLPEIGQTIFAVIRNDILGRIKAFNPEFLPGHRLTAITESAVELTRTADGQAVSLNCDHVVLALGLSPMKGLAAGFENAVKNVILIGDTHKPGRIFEAIREGFDRAYHYD